MALECLKEAEASDDGARKKSLIGIARLYNETALAMEAAEESHLPAADRVP
jgi:hypothetical protein